jgi:hypothetical protein
MKPLARLVRIAAACALSIAVPLSAGAEVRKEGAWPEAEKKVSLEFEGKPSDGLDELAARAGWSLVVSKGITVGEHDVRIRVTDQPADAVLDALFAESSVVARRTGSLVSIAKAERAPSPAPPPGDAPPAAEAAPVPPEPPVAPAPPEVPRRKGAEARGEDRNVFGGSVTIEEGEVVHTVTVTGGSAKVRGTVTGDLVVAGGSAKVEEGAHVLGNATVFGGSLKVASGARVDGDVGVVMGSLKREPGAIIGGKVVDGGKNGSVKVSVNDGDVSTTVEESHAPPRSRLSEAAHSFGQSLTRKALLFVFGCVLLALATRRMDLLRKEVAARPMRAFAAGIVASLAALVAFLVLCVTVVGIPLALLALLVGVFAVYGAIAAVVTTLGAALIGHKTQNPYLHLLLGCALLLVVGMIPYVGGLVTFAVAMIGMGVLATTRLGGALARPAARPLV